MAVMAVPGELIVDVVVAWNEAVGYGHIVVQLIAEIGRLSAFGGIGIQDARVK